jgi:hypothetical protein
VIPQPCHYCNMLVSRDREGRTVATNPAVAQPWACPARSSGHLIAATSAVPDGDLATGPRVSDLWQESEGDPDRFRALMAEHDYPVRTHEEDFWLSLLPPPSGRYSFTRDELIDALAHLEVRVATSGPDAGKIDAESMADAIIEAFTEVTP